VLPGELLHRAERAEVVGNPADIETTFTVSGRAGIFQGATGSGTDSDMNAGDSVMRRFNGTLTLA
jgi:hypothetical protein